MTAPRPAPAAELASRDLYVTLVNAAERYWRALEPGIGADNANRVIARYSEAMLAQAHLIERGEVKPRFHLEPQDWS